MIGFPGARYDYRDWVHRHNERYPYPPVSIDGPGGLDIASNLRSRTWRASSPQRMWRSSASAGRGSILAHELTDEGLDVVAIERGPWRDTATDFPPNYDQDELRYRIRHELFLRPEQTDLHVSQQDGADRRCRSAPGVRSCR